VAAELEAVRVSADSLFFTPSLSLPLKRGRVPDIVMFNLISEFIFAYKRGRVAIFVINVVLFMKLPCIITASPNAWYVAVRPDAAQLVAM
jgi:hypothetical protein